MRDGIDYSSGTLAGAAIKAAGYDFTIRYITSPDLANPPGRNAKHITPPEHASHRAAGVRDLYVYQDTTSDSSGGFSAGVRNALRVKVGWSWIGAEPDFVFFTNDSPTLPNTALWRAYLDGAASVLGLGLVGAYGFGNAIDAALGHASVFWQSGRESDVRSHVHIYQWNNGAVTIAGKTCDLDKLKKTLPLQGTDMAAVDWDAEYTFSRTGDKLPFGNWIGETNDQANQARAAANAAVAGLADLKTSMEARLTALEAKVSSPPIIDYDLLASKIAQAQAAANADEIARRMES